MQEVIEQIKEKTIVVNSFNQVDVSEMECPIIAVFIRPQDYPESVVARMFDLDKPTNIIIFRETLEEVREDIIRTFPNMVRFDRAKNDDRCIAETWI